MALPRSKYVQDGEIGVYHCTTRCVRRAFLYGYDAYSGRNYSHRKAWISERLQVLSSIFAIEVFEFSVMANHYHVILRTRPDIVQGWSDYEVASRWLTLCPNRYRSKKKPPPAIEDQIRALASCSDRIAELRRRLSNLSWFMARLNEYIARAANEEDDVKGRFWESRFKCQVLLDDAAIAACMVYVGLNPIRAGQATTPEDSDFTGIQLRIRSFRSKTGKTQKKAPPDSADWLYPISSDMDPNGILTMSTEEYFDLVDRSGRIIRSDKQGFITEDIEPILYRLGVISSAWLDTVSNFGDKFHLVAGLLHNIRSYADRIGSRWFVGVSSARAVFNSST